MKPVLTATDLSGIAPGGEVTVTSDTIVTPLAREEAERLGITLRITEGASSVSIPSASPADSPSAPGNTSANTPAKKGVVALGADHGGYELKRQLAVYLRDWGYQVLDLGAAGADPVDYPDFAEAVALAVARGDAERGIVIDGAGIGSAMAANKVPGARAALCYDRATARNSREHNDANILSLGARFLPLEFAREILAVWLETPFAGGRHQRRVDKIRAIEQKYSRELPERREEK
jgi:ribose 5-phosphate isomerase B